MNGQVPQDPQDQKPPEGLSFGTYALVAVVLAGAFAWIRLHKTAEEQAKPEELPPAAAPARDPRAPMPMPGSETRRPSARPKVDDSLGFVSGNKDIKGAVLAPGESGPPMRSGILPMGPGATPMDNGAMTFSGEGGPAGFEGRVVKTQEAWNALWRSVGGHDMPPLDAKKEMAVAVFGGTQPSGSAVQIFGAETVKGRLVVRYRVEKPAQLQSGTCRPYTVMLVPATNAPVVFQAVR